MPAIQTAIAAVIVYTDRARVTRRGNVHLALGAQSIVLEGLAPSLLEDSVRASGRGQGVKVLGVEVETRFVTRPPEETIAELTKQLEALKDGEQALADEDATAEARIEFLDTLGEAGGRTLAKGLAFGNTDLERIEMLAGYLERERTAVDTRRRGIAQKRREQKREIEAVQARLNQLQHGETRQRRDIRVEVEAAAETELELEITYVVTGASWKPLYDLRLQGEAVALTYLASISQRSGEDWPAVELSLSTARPSFAAEIPELEPWFIDVQRPPRPIAARAAYAPMQGEVPESAPMPAPMTMATKVADVAMTTIESNGAAVTSRVARPVAVPSDGAPHKTTVTVLELAARLDHLTAPKLAEEAYQRARVKNTSPFILLPGSANVFHGPDFVGTTDLETIAPNEEFEAHLGVDERIKVERELVERTVDKTLIGNTRRMVFGYKITITNLLAAPARITVLDQLPVSRHEELKVKLRDATPKPAEQSDLNILKWELELKPQEKREITLGFTVEHPREMRLSGIAD